MTREEVETWIAELCTSRGELYLNRTRDEARRLAPQLGADRAMVTLDKLTSAALNTNDSIALTSAELIARASGAPFDAQRLMLFSRLAEFVDPEMVEGTLRRGFDLGAGLVSPFARATYLMFVTAEVHLFADGNASTARIMMNAELAAVGEVRIIIPTVYRLNYLAAFKAATHGNNVAALLATLSFARRWTGRIDFTNRSTAESDLARTNALRDAKEAEGAGIRLVLP